MAIRDSTSGFEAEMRISPRPVLAALLAVEGLLFLGAEILSYPWHTVDRIISLLLCLSVVSGIGWLIVGWKPLVGRWFTILVLVVAVHLTGLWLGMPASLALAVIPTALAVPLVGFTAAGITAIGESLLVVALAGYPASKGNSSDVFVAVIAIWAVFGAMYSVYHGVRQRSAWLGEYFERGQRFLEEARDHRAELEQALDDLAHANRQLALMNERVTALRLIAEEAQQAKTRFVAKVSHEFRTPLNMIIGLIDLMVESPEMYDVTLSPRMREDLKTVHRNCEHLADMVNDVLDLTRIEADRLVLHRERVDIGQVIGSAVEAVRPLLERKQLALHISVPEDLPQVYCDRTRIEQVILNLMSNAARYTEEGGITVRIARQDQHVRVSVADTGPGIPPKDVERIFEPFSQGTSDLWRDKGGSGLGLSISKEFVELHGGRMWVESELGVGSTFTFELPISSPIAPVARPGYQIREDWIWHARQSRPSFPDSHYNPRLIVCDETGDLYTVLSHHSAEVEFVDTRDLGQAVRASQQSPAHAIMLNATACDTAWSLIETIGQEAPGTPIIGCSVSCSLERARALGALGYLVKPVTRANLKQAIQAAGSPVKRVLIVDDDPDALRLFSRMLRVCDSTLEVVTASNGEEALDQLRHTPPDLMLLDIVMPDMDGWQVLELMAQDEQMQKVPTFFVSAQDLEEQPPLSRFLLVTMDEGLSLNRLLRCSLEISKLLLQPERVLGPASG
jgi:signal transduction histidine kinase/CheY-like chemotaxis protein